ETHLQYHITLNQSDRIICISEDLIDHANSKRLVKEWGKVSCNLKPFAKSSGELSDFLFLGGRKFLVLGLAQRLPRDNRYHYETKQEYSYDSHTLSNRPSISCTSPSTAPG